MNDLKSNLYSDFTPSHKDGQLYELAKQYHNECELYDRTVCTHKNERGIAMPSNHYEMMLINRNALAVRKKFADKALILNINKRELINAIQRFNDY